MRVFKEDGFYHRDGLARVIVNPKEPCVTRPGQTNAAPPSTTDDVVVPPPPTITPSWPGVSGGTTWTPQLTSLPIACSDMAVSVAPTTSPVPLVLMLGPVAQPFTLAAPFGGGNATFVVRLAKRDVPDWMSSFSSRSVTVSILSGFPAVPATVATGTVGAASLATVSLDVISGTLDDPASAADMAEFSIAFAGLPPMPAASTYALSLEDATYGTVVSEYGANAKFFVMAAGQDAVPGNPYYMKE